MATPVVRHAERLGWGLHNSITNNSCFATHVDEGDGTKHTLIDSLGREQQAIFINESGLYSLILSSKLESARRFKHWVTSEVLPSIRKQGGYMVARADEPDEVLFCGRDVAKALGYKKPENALAQHVEKGDTLKQGTPTTSGIQQMLFINESGLYSLILSSKLDGARRFKHWVTSEVLPSIRKQGGYMMARADEPDEVLFCGRDVAKALGYKKPENAIATHVDDEDKTSTLIQGSGSNYKYSITV